jgi:hypothetical protein
VRSPAATTFLLTRAAIWLAALLAYESISPHRNPGMNAAAQSPIQHDLGAGTDLWAHWDGAYFLNIAEHSYAASSSGPTAAFFPLYPGALAVAGRILGGHYILAGILLSLSTAFVAAILLDRLARLHGIDGNRAVLYLALFPMSFYLQAVYSEAFFLLLAIAAMLFAERGQFALAAWAAGFATLARPAAIAVVLAVAILAWRSEHRRRALAWLAVVPFVFAAFPLTLREQTGHPWSFLHTEQVWHRHLSAAGPFGGIWEGLRAGWDGLVHLLNGTGPTTLFLDARQFASTNLESAAFLVLFLWLTVETWRRLGAAYGVFAAVCLGLPLSLPAQFFPLLSLPRFGLVIFPFYLVLAQLGANSRFNTAVLAISGVLLGVSVTQWALWNWVA